MTTTDRDNLTAQFNILIECIEAGDTESAVQWLRAAVANLEREDIERQD